MKHSVTLQFLLFTNTLVLFASTMFAPISALFIQGLGAELLDVGVATAFFALFAGMTTLFSGHLTDTMQKKATL